MTGAPPLPIVRLGAAGDGIAKTPSGTSIYVAGGLPGEMVLNGGSGAIEPSSPDRVVPPCPHFGVCGGCVAQHMGDALYASWKRDIVVEALAHRALTPPVDPLVRIAPRTRRRVTFALAQRSADIGFHQARSETVVPLSDCPVTAPRIVAALSGLAGLVARLTPEKSRADVRIAVAELDGGLDVDISGVRPPATPTAHAEIAAAAGAIGLARLSIARDVLLVRATPRLVTRAGAIVPPPAAFFQAVAPAEAAIVAAVLAALPPKAKRVADLFCGLGTLTLPLAQRVRVFAVDDDPSALAALVEAARATQGLKPIETRRRDLFREPLSVKELDGFDAVVLDPPRAGAKAQVDVLAAAAPPAIVMVSCDPGTLARDLRRLVDAGYGITRVTPIDQFLWSAHVEVVAALERAPTRRRRGFSPSSART
jgi:23S rRNA (uracil1939-C5)-methyltransferase